MKIKVLTDKELIMPEFVNNEVGEKDCIISERGIAEQFDCAGIPCMDCIFRKSNYDALQNTYKLKLLGI